MSLEFVKDIAVEFGGWLLKQGCIPAESMEIPDEQLWDTKDGDWLSMSDLFDKWSAEKRNKA